MSKAPSIPNTSQVQTSQVQQYHEFRQMERPMSKAPSIPNTSQVQQYHEFVVGLRKTPPTETEFKVGQIVAYVNDYGVIFPGHEIIGYAAADEYFFTEYGKFIYLNLDCYWCSVSPGSLRVMDEDGNFEIREGEVVYQSPAL